MSELSQPNHNVSQSSQAGTFSEKIGLSNASRKNGSQQTINAPIIMPSTCRDGRVAPG